jgi:hypothetical protein
MGHLQIPMKPQESEAETKETETKPEEEEKDPLRSPFFGPEIVSSESQDLAFNRNIRIGTIPIRTSKKRTIN